MTGKEKAEKPVEESKRELKKEHLDVSSDKETSSNDEASKEISSEPEQENQTEPGPEDPGKAISSEPEPAAQEEGRTEPVEEKVASKSKKARKKDPKQDKKDDQGSEDAGKEISGEPETAAQKEEKIEPVEEKVASKSKEARKKDPKQDKKGSKDKGPKKKTEKKEPPKKGSAKEEEGVKDPLEGFEMQSREEVVGLLIGKHSDLKKKYESELKGLDAQPPEIVQEKEEEKDIRDTMNEEVQILKGKRKELKIANKRLREEFFDLLDKEEKLKGHKKEVSMYSKFSKDLEWKLETEAITIETERRLLDELRDTMDKMRSITDGFTPQEIHSRLTEIQEEMGSNLMQIEDYHRQVLDKVGESNLHHGKFIDAKKQIRERESRRGWLKRRIELHVEMEKFWSGQMDQAKKLDTEEFSRDLGSIKDALLKLFKERETTKEESNEKGAPKYKHTSKEKKVSKDSLEKKEEAGSKPSPEDKKDDEAPKKEESEKSGIGAKEQEVSVVDQPSTDAKSEGGDA
jgi:uncharacterized coiled-coil DUF342 family protein